MADLSQYKAGIEAAMNAMPQICSDPRSAFMGVLSAEGFQTPRTLQIGKIARIDGQEDKRGKQSAWYVYNEIEDNQQDGAIIGIASYGDWKLGITHSWCSRSEHKMDTAERASYIIARDEMRRQQEQETILKQTEAADRAFKIWSEAPQATEHPYLTKKGIQPSVGVKISNDGKLILPIAIEGQITSLQFIDNEGNKRFLTGGRLKGGWFKIEGEEDVIYIAEGYSTGRSVSEATGKTVFVCFNAGNIYEAAADIKNTWSGSRIIIAGDDDTTTAGNPGRAKAEQAAQGLGPETIFPDGFNDFNDMHHELGIEALKRFLCQENLEVYEEEPEENSSAIERPSGLLGDIFDYYNATSGNVQHGFAVQAALAIVSIVAGRNFRTNYNNYSSLYFMCVGKTGTGKEHIKTVIEDVLGAAGLDHYIAGDGYTSAGAVYSTLLDRPKHMPVVDEIGRYLEASVKQAGQHNQREANTKIIEAFGRCHGVMRPLNYSAMTMKKADADNIKNRLIQSPAITFMGMTVPKTLFDTLDMNAIKDGFINRFCISISEAKRGRRHHKEILPVPQRIIDQLLAIHNRGGTQNSAIEKPSPIDIFFTSEANTKSLEFEDWCIDTGLKLEKYGMDGLTIRGDEIAKRISLCHALSRDPYTEIINEHDMSWSTKYKKILLKKIIKELKVTLSHSGFEAHKKEILASLRELGQDGMTWAVMQKTPPYSQHKPKDLKEIMQSLKDADLVGDEPYSNGKGRPTVRWMAIK